MVHAIEGYVPKIKTIVSKVTTATKIDAIVHSIEGYADKFKDIVFQVTAATGIDAMVHAIEGYTSKFKKNVLSDVLAREALKLLSENIR